MSNKQKFSKASFKKKCQNKNWDDLALHIIELEFQLYFNPPKNIETLQEKIQILEDEKSNRVSSCFNVKHFLNKEYETFEVEYDDFSDT